MILGEGIKGCAFVCIYRKRGQKADAVMRFAEVASGLRHQHRSSSKIRKW